MVAPKGGPEGWGAQNFALFSLALFSFFLPLLGVVSWNFGGVIEGQDNQMCTFGLLGLSCEAPAAPKGGDPAERSRGSAQILDAPTILNTHRTDTPHHTTPQHNNDTPHNTTGDPAQGGLGQGGPLAGRSMTKKKKRHEQQIVPKSSPIGQGFFGVKDGSQRFGHKTV